MEPAKPVSSCAPVARPFVALCATRNRASIYSLTLLTSLLVLALSLAGDAAGAATPAGLGTKAAAWTIDCQLTGQSASTVSFATGIAAALLTLLTSISGCLASGGACFCFCFAAEEVNRSLRVFLNLACARLFLIAGLCLYVYILARLAASLHDCGRCKSSYDRWLFGSPHTNAAGYVCAEPVHLHQLPAGTQTGAGILCGLGLICLGRMGTAVLELTNAKEDGE